MNTILPPPKLHPALLAAALSVSAVALAGIGVLTGVVPFSPKAAETPPAAEQTIPVPATLPAAPAAKAAPAPLKRSTAKPAQVADRGGPDTEVIRRNPTADGRPVAAAPCHDCGVIESVQEIAREGEASGLGAAAGGLVGGILGRQIGNGSGRDIATVLGAIGGAVAGHQIEKTQKKSVQYEVVVRFEDGTSRVLTQDAPPAWRQGDKVKFANGVLVAN